MEENNDLEMDTANYIKDIDILGLTNMDKSFSIEESAEPQNSSLNLLEEFLTNI